MRRLASVLAAGAALLVTSCGSEVTSTRLERSMAANFDHLLALQQARLGAAGVKPEQVAATAGCFRRTPTGPKTGAGDDWQCTVEYPAAGGTAIARFDVQAKPDGCYRAEGAPVDVGRATLVTHTGKQVVNPLAEFDGCYDTSWGART